MFLCIGKAHEMYKFYGREGRGAAGRRNTPGPSSNAGVSLRGGGGKYGIDGGGLIFVEAGVE